MGIGTSTQAKHRFRAGDTVQGESIPVADSRTEPVDFYKTARLKLRTRGPEAGPTPPSWLGVPPELPVYRERGHRRLDSKTYKSRCRACLWRCRMPVDMIIDPWKPAAEVESYHYPSASNPWLQVADYCAWAVLRHRLAELEVDALQEGAVRYY